MNHIYYVHIYTYVQWIHGWLHVNFIGIRTYLNLDNNLSEYTVMISTPMIITTDTDTEMAITEPT